PTGRAGRCTPPAGLPASGPAPATPSVWCGAPGERAAPTASPSCRTATAYSSTAPGAAASNSRERAGAGTRARWLLVESTHDSDFTSPRLRGEVEIRIANFG